MRVPKNANVIAFISGFLNTHPLKLSHYLNFHCILHLLFLNDLLLGLFEMSPCLSLSLWWPVGVFCVWLTRPWLLEWVRDEGALWWMLLVWNGTRPRQRAVCISIDTVSHALSEEAQELLNRPMSPPCFRQSTCASLWWKAFTSSLNCCPGISSVIYF